MALPTMTVNYSLYRIVMYPLLQMCLYRWGIELSMILDS